MIVIEGEFNGGNFLGKEDVCCWNKRKTPLEPEEDHVGINANLIFLYFNHQNRVLTDAAPGTLVTTAFMCDCQMRYA